MRLILFILTLLIFINANGQNTSFGTTVITHGFQPTGSSSTIANGSMYGLAEAILKRAGVGKILRYNKNNGMYRLVKSTGSGGEIILLFDWAVESNNDVKGYSEAAADALFSSLLLGYKKGQFKLTAFHFIGHSRGTVVNTLAVERLLVLNNKYPGLYNASIDQVTNLDPHDWGFLGIASDMNDAHPEITISIPPDQSPNNGTIAWNGVFSDTYYQTNPPLIGEVNLHGRPVNGTMNFHWNTNDQGLILRHGDPNGIHSTGYKRTIDNDIKIATREGSEGGYHLSRIGGERNLRPPSIFGGNNPTFSFFSRKSSGRITGIINGSFDRGSGNSIPGWEEHGGKTGASIVPGGFVRFSSSSGKSITHNRFYIPKDAKKIKFKLKAERIGAPIKFEAYINSQVVYSEALDSVSSVFVNKSFDVSKFNDQVVTLNFSVNAPIGNFLSTQIALDDVELSKESDQVSSTLFLFDLSGSMNDNGGGTIPKIEQAKQASQSSLRALSTNSQGVQNQVAVYGFAGGCSPDPTREFSPFDTDLIAVEQRILQMQAGGGTPLGNAIRAAECKMAAHLQLTGQTKGKLILLSDGQGTCGAIRPAGVYNSAPLQHRAPMIIDANQCGLPAGQPLAVSYYTVGFNIPAGSPAERDLQYLSQSSRGKYLNVQNQTQLTRAFRKFNRVYRPKMNPATSTLSRDNRADFQQGVNVILDERFPTALQDWETLAKSNPDDCHVVYNLALAQEANDLYREAIDNYQQYLNLCPSPDDEAFVLAQIAFLEEEFRQFVAFQRDVVLSDLAYLELHFKQIQNGQSLRLAAEFKGFLQEKGNYYALLPRLLASNDRFLKNLTEDIASALNRASAMIKRSPETWDRDATPVISMLYLNLKDLKEEM